MKTGSLLVVKGDMFLMGEPPVRQWFVVDSNDRDDVIYGPTNKAKAEGFVLGWDAALDSEDRGRA